MGKCKKCGRKSYGNSKFCPQCGEKLKSKNFKKNILISILLIFICTCIIYIIYKSEDNSTNLSDSYIELLDRADVLIESANFEEAKSILEKAKEIHNTDDVNEKLDEVNKKIQQYASQEASNDTEEEKEVTNKVKVSEEALKNILSNSTSEVLQDFIYDDFDKDGQYEAFATTIHEAYKYNFWFITIDGASFIKNIDLNWSSHKFSTIDLNNEKHLVLNTNIAAGSGHTCSVYKVSGKNVDCLYEDYGNINGNKLGQVVYSIESVDAEVDKISGLPFIKSYKLYYLYYDGNKYKEYGGTQISKEEFLKYKNSSDVLNKIEENYKNEYSPNNIDMTFWRRENNIINIDCRVENETNIYNLWIAIKYGEDGVEELSSGTGVLGASSGKFQLDN